MVAQGAEPDQEQQALHVTEEYTIATEFSDHQSPNATATNYNESSYQTKPLTSNQESKATLSLSYSTSYSFSEDDTKQPTYWNLLRYNRPYRLYISSYLFTKTGEWFTYVASIDCIERFVPDSYTAISILIVVRLIPNLLLTMFGGALADGRDKRHSMIFLDCMGVVVALLFLLVIRTESLLLLYLITFVQQSITAIYEPVRQSMVPMLVEDDEFLKKAVSMTSLAWSVVAFLGAGLGGVAAAMLGVPACYALDALSYLSSAYLMYLVGGSWNAAKSSSRTNKSENCFDALSSLWSTFRSMTGDGIQYLRQNFFGPLVFLKASGAFIFGASDILNVAFSEQENDEKGSSIRLGVLFACMATGSFFGPLIAERFTSMKNMRSLQVACIVGYTLITLGMAGMGYYPGFLVVCLFSMLRSSGSSIMWINSSILLQKFSSTDMVGRVSAVDFAFATLCEAASAVIAGVLQDRVGLSPTGVCYVFSAIGTFVASFWLFFDVNGGGASNPLAQIDNVEYANLL